jgi:hypothetical protein
MTTSVLIHALDELMGIHDITLTGGEPLLHPDFDKVVAQAAKNASLVYLMTNGINLIGKENLLQLSKKGDLSRLKQKIKRATKKFPENIHFFFPLDSFHLRAFKPFAFLLKGLAEVAQEFNSVPEKPFFGFLCNEISPKKSENLMSIFRVASYTHVGTATFSPWRNEKDIRQWYSSHNLNLIPFPGGIYVNYKGVYLNEASLLMDLRHGIQTPLKIGSCKTNNREKNQLHGLYAKALKRLF